MGGGGVCINSTFSWPRHAPASLPPEKQAPGKHWIGGQVGPRTGLDDVEKIKFFNLPRLELRPLRSQSRYRLSYRGSFNANVSGIYSDHSALKGRQSVCVWICYTFLFRSALSIFVCPSRRRLLITEHVSIGPYRLSARPVVMVCSSSTWENQITIVSDFYIAGNNTTFYFTAQSTHCNMTLH
jgi:hypothetical protein